MTQASAPSSSTGERVLFEGNRAMCPTAWSVLLSVLTLGLALIYFALRAKSVRYRITTERVVVERGLLSKHMDQIDLYRINDYVVERPFGQRLAGTGNLILSAMDRSSPELRIEGIKTDVMALYEALRKATEEQKAKRGVRTVDTELLGHGAEGDGLLLG